MKAQNDNKAAWVELDGKSGPVSYQTPRYGKGEYVISAFGIEGRGKTAAQANADFKRKFQAAGGKFTNCSSSPAFQNGVDRASTEIANKMQNCGLMAAENAKVSDRYHVEEYGGQFWVEDAEGGSEDGPYRDKSRAQEVCDKRNKAGRYQNSRVQNYISGSDGNYTVHSESGKRLGGPYKTKGEAEKRLEQVEYFKHQNSGNPYSEGWEAGNKSHREGRSISCPYPRNSKEEKDWYEGYSEGRRSATEWSRRPR